MRGPGYVLGDSCGVGLGFQYEGSGRAQVGGQVWAVQIWEGTAKGWAPLPTYSTLSNPWSIELVIHGPLPYHPIRLLIGAASIGESCLRKSFH